MVKNTPQPLGRKGIDILANIMQHMQPLKMRTLLRNLSSAEPRIAEQLQKMIFSFERLAACDDRGLQKLLRQISIRDLALSLRDADEVLLERMANNMSRRSIEDLRLEISHAAAARPPEVEAARQRIVNTARQLIDRSEMYLQSGNQRDELID